MSFTAGTSMAGGVLMTDVGNEFFGKRRAVHLVAGGR